MASLNIKKAGSCYLCCDSCLRLGRESILDNRSTSLWSCTAHTPGCTLGDGCSSLPPRMSCCWSPGEAPGDKNIQPLFLVPLCTGDCSPLWPYDTYLWWGKNAQILKNIQVLEDRGSYSTVNIHKLSRTA